MHSVFQPVSKGIFYFVRIKLLSWKPHLEAPCWLIVLECSRKTDFAAAWFHLCSLLSQTRRRPLPVSVISGAACFPGSLWEGLSPRPQSPLPWADCLQPGSREGTALLHLAPYFIFTYLYWWGGDPPEIQVSLDWLPGRRRRPEESLREGSSKAA